VAIDKLSNEEKLLVESDEDSGRRRRRIDDLLLCLHGMMKPGSRMSNAVTQTDDVDSALAEELRCAHDEILEAKHPELELLTELAATREALGASEQSKEQVTNKYEDLKTRYQQLKIMLEHARADATASQDEADRVHQALSEASAEAALLRDENERLRDDVCVSPPLRFSPFFGSLLFVWYVLTNCVGFSVQALVGC